ncbi:hypothetical protein ACH4SP_10620 [Streptomyces sp. NPDC021093]|uniref:hypothetical protein n=1 Tax=Streptomyces sp. NPDC021093 TaxID=3365112 RepID=UPI0037AFAF8C
MATSESATAGATAGTTGSPVPRAAALAVLAEEPTSGLFPPDKSEKPKKPEPKPEPKGSEKPAAEEASEKPAAEEAKAKKPAVTSASTPSAASKTEEKAKEKKKPTGKATTTTAAATTATAATTAATTTTGNATTTATATATPPRRTSGLPLGRPGKPMLAAAVAGGLILVGVPFLISGLSDSGDDVAPASAQAPAGSRIGPDGSGPGLVPGQQNAPGENVSNTGGGNAQPGGATAERSSGQAGGIHEGGGGAEKKGTANTEGTTGAGPGPNGKEVQTVPAEKNGVPAAPGTPAKPGVPAGPPPADKPAGNEKQAAPPVTYNHLIGPGCNTAGFATSDQWRDSNKGWRGSNGSQTVSGCSGFYYSVPLSNSTSKSNGFAQWKFSTGSVTKGSCKVSVYIPKVKDISYVGGSPAYYTVHRAFVPKSSTVIGTFEINQTAHLGQWVYAGSFPATGKVSVVMDNRGKTSGNRHAAAAPVKVSCSS